MSLRPGESLYDFVGGPYDGDQFALGRHSLRMFILSPYDGTTRHNYELRDGVYYWTGWE